jgi:NMD protein affecting ribosome stability and mRNA decay
MLSGNFLAARKAEIDNLITNTVDISSRKNPLGRIMETTRTKEGITITTTDVKLAQKIGREIFKAHGGDLRFQWNHEEDLVRVNWSRS